MSATKLLISFKIRRLEQDELDDDLRNTFQNHDIKSLDQVKNSFCLFDLSSADYYDIGALLWLISLLNRLKKQGNELQLIFPEANSKPRIWDFFIRWRFFKALSLCVDDPVNLLRADQTGYLARPSKYQHGGGHDEHGTPTTTFLTRILEITTIRPRGQDRPERQDEIDEFLGQYKDRVIQGALSARCGWDPVLTKRFVQQVVGEGLQNTFLHSEGTFTNVSMTMDKKNLILAIADNGVGIPNVLRNFARLVKNPTIRGQTDVELIKYFAGPDMILDSGWIKLSTQKGVTSAPTLQPIRNVDDNTEQRILDRDEVRSKVKFLFGHFALSQYNQAAHTNAVASVAELAKNEDFVEMLHSDIQQKLKTSQFVVCPLGIELGGIQELAAVATRGRVSRILLHRDLDRHNGSPIVLLCDVLSDIYPLFEAVQTLRSRTSPRILLAGVGKARDLRTLAGVDLLYYFETEFCSAFTEATCGFCNQGISVIKGEDFNQFGKNIGEYDHYTFWKLLAYDKTFYSVGHWESKRTGNHYEFTVNAKPIFKDLGYDIAYRIRNVMRENKILPGWVRRIVCPQKEESEPLAQHLADVLGLDAKDVVKIPREYYSEIAGRDLNPNLREFMKAENFEEKLRDQCVVIIDQAVHHYKTLSALRNICQYYNCVILAFAVFVDRTDPSYVVGDYLHESHLISLFSWRFPPRLAHDCPCYRLA